ncbi:MAG: glycosyltransferase [Flaviramulus sp.]|nr:glycosyltransferase [Flaviramulus sp.]
MKFSVSVIIPAYNVERFIEKAIKSALLQAEVNEILVLDDGSTDKTLQLIENLQNKNSKIKIYHHNNKANKGRSASRNLGIKHAKENYVAFLDADDFYLENRFTNDKLVFEKDLTTDGVYNAVGFHFYREATVLEKEKLRINTLSKKIEPEALFDAVISSKYGDLHLNGITVKKAVFNSTGIFNESLMVAEDSDIIIKMALKCQLEPGIINKPLALRGIHETNIFTREDLYKKYRLKLYESVISWCFKNQIPLKNTDVVLNYLWVIRFREKYSLLANILYWKSLLLNNPKLIFSYLSVKYFPIIRLRQMLFPFLYR